MISTLPTALQEAISAYGYYPALVADCVTLSVAGESVAGHLVQGEATFDGQAVRRHLTVLALTPTRLVFVHADDNADDVPGPEAMAFSTSEAVPLGVIRSVVLAMGVTDPLSYQAGDQPSEVTMTISWGAVSRLDIEPAICPDPNCTADHGYTGTQASDDLVIRVSRAADGAKAVAAAVDFARKLSAATARS